MDKPFFHELANIKVSNRLYNGWLEYILSLTREDVLDIVDNGFTYQANALRSMVREVIAGQPIPGTLPKKLDTIVIAAQKAARSLR